MAPIAIHLERIKGGLRLFRSDHSHIQVLVIIAQRLAVPVGMCEPAIFHYQREGIGQVFIGHQHVAHLRVHCHQGMACLQQPLIGWMAEFGFHLLAQQNPLRCRSIKDMAAGFIRLRLYGDPHARNGIHGFDEAVCETVSGGDKIHAEGIFIAIYAGPDHTAVCFEFFVEFQGFDGALYGGAAGLSHRRREGAPFEL